MKINLGNLQPNQEIKIIITYIENLKVSMNQFWQLAIPVVLTERYSPGNHKNPDSVKAGSQTIDGKSKQAY